MGSSSLKLVKMILLSQAHLNFQNNYINRRLFNLFPLLDSSVILYFMNERYFPLNRSQGDDGIIHTPNSENVRTPKPQVFSKTLDTTPTGQTFDDLLRTLAFDNAENQELGDLERTVQEIKKLGRKADYTLYSKRNELSDKYGVDHPER